MRNGIIQGTLAAMILAAISACGGGAFSGSNGKIDNDASRPGRVNAVETGGNGGNGGSGSNAGGGSGISATCLADCGGRDGGSVGIGGDGGGANQGIVNDAHFRHKAYPSASPDAPGDGAARASGMSGGSDGESDGGELGDHFNSVTDPVVVVTNSDVNGDTTCPDGAVLTGFDGKGDPLCTSLPSLACPAGEVLRGADFAKAEPVCTKIHDRLYSVRDAIVHSTVASQPDFYFGTAKCAAGDVVLFGGGRCAAADYGSTASFAAVSDGEPADGALTMNAWRHNCVLKNGIGAGAFVYALCLKSN